MKKQIFALIFSLIIMLNCVFCVLAAEISENVNPLLIDNQNLLSYAEKEALELKLEEISSSINADIVILTTDELDGVSDMAFCDEFFDNSGYGRGDEKSGLLFAFDAFDYDGALYYVSTGGNMIYSVSDYVIDIIISDIKYDLKYGNYYDAFCTFADECYTYAYGEQDTDPANYGDIFPSDEQYYYDFPYYGYNYTTPKASFVSVIPKYAVISLVIGLIIALITVSAMKSKLKSVGFQKNATHYLRGGVNLTQSRDSFLYHHVAVRPKPKNPPPTNRPGGMGGTGGVHMSSGGSFHGGHGGRL